MSSSRLLGNRVPSMVASWFMFIDPKSSTAIKFKFFQVAPSWLLRILKIRRPSAFFTPGVRSIIRVKSSENGSVLISIFAG